MWWNPSNLGAGASELLLPPSCLGLLHAWKAPLSECQPALDPPSQLIGHQHSRLCTPFGASPCHGSAIMLLHMCWPAQTQIPQPICTAADAVSTTQQYVDYC